MLSSTTIIFVLFIFVFSPFLFCQPYYFCLIHLLVGTEHLPRTAQVVDQGIQLLQVFFFCCIPYHLRSSWEVLRADQPLNVLYGARCAEFLFKEKAIRPFMVLYSLVAIIGATVDLGLLWSIAETFNGLMAIPNLIAVFLLSGVVVKLVKEYFAGEGKNA